MKLLVSMAIICCVAISAQAKNQRFIIKLNNQNLTLSEMGEIFKANSIEWVTPESKSVVIEREVGEVNIVLEELNNNELVEYAEEDHELFMDRMPNDPRVNKQWGHFHKEHSINIEQAWQSFTGSKDIIVGIVDSGIHGVHEDLAANLWENLAEKNGVEGVDDDGNGYIDDIQGYNFAHRQGKKSKDWHGHGTHVAGIVGAVGNNGVGGVGVNWNVSLMQLAIFNKKFTAYLTYAVRAIDYAIEKKVHILQNSWGTNKRSRVLEEAIERARQAGILFVASAGNKGRSNDHTRHFPATFKHDNIISVAASTRRGQLAQWSNFGSQSVHLAAPGENIFSTFYMGGYKTLSGTSMAAPYVSGVAALIWGANPTWTYMQVKNRLMNTVTRKKKIEKRTMTGGVLNAYEALRGPR